MQFLIYVLIILLSCSCGSMEEKKHEDDTVPAVPVQTTKPKRPEDSVNEDELLDAMIEPARDEWQKPGIVIGALGELRDKVVAEVGTGTGYFTFKIAQRQPGVARVIALDHKKRQVNSVEDKRVTRFSPEIASKIETRLCTDSTVALGPGEADALLMANCLAFIPDPAKYLTSLKENLKPNGKLVMVEFKSQKMPVGPAPGLKLPTDTIVSLLERAGWQLERIDTAALPYQNLFVALP